MKTKLLIVAAIYLIGLVASSTASATFVVIPSNPAAAQIPFESWAQEAKAPLPDATVKIYNAPCPSSELAGGCTRQDSLHRYSIWIEPYYTPSQDIAFKHIFYHEISHVFDSRHLNRVDRKRATKYLGYPHSTEWGSETNGINGTFMATPQEWFAEAGSFCYGGAAANYPAYQYPYGYGPETLKICDLMNRAGSQTRVIPTRTNYKLTILGAKRFTAPQLFEKSSIRIKLIISGKVFNWGNSCQSSTRYKKLNVILNGCGKKLVGRTIGTGKVTIQYSGVPYSAYSE